jgi:dihydroflavonol-4-reductase
MILITGATGFLGSELARQLSARDSKIKCLKRSHSAIPATLIQQTNIEWHEADITDIFTLEEALEGVSQVYHCAAMVSFDPADKKKLLQTNVEGTANLVNLCTERNIRLLHVSSIAAIGEAKPGELINENHHLELFSQQNAYALSKYQSEMEVWRGTAEGLNAVIVNPSIIIGKNAGREGSGRIFETIRKGISFYTSGSCGLVDVEDVAHCMIRLMESNITDERFIINAENWTYKSLFNTVARLFHLKEPAILAKSWMMEIAWRAAGIISMISGQKPGIDKVSARAASVDQRFDHTKITQALDIDFKPVMTTLQEIVERLEVIDDKSPAGR